MNWKTGLVIACAAGIAWAGVHAPEAAAKQAGKPPAAREAEGAAPQFSHSDAIINLHLPISTWSRCVLEGIENGDSVRVERTRLAETKSFRLRKTSVDAVIVEDRSFRSGELEELTRDYFAQADDGTVYYLGEDVAHYRRGRVVGHEGSWRSGVKGRPPGVLMPARPKLGDRFYAENVPGITVEADEVDSLGLTITTPSGTYRDCLRIVERLSDGGVEYKYYARGVGVVREVSRDGRLDLVSQR